MVMSDDGGIWGCPSCNKPESVCVCTEATIVVEEIFNQLCHWRARLCNYDFYARHIPLLQEAHGDEAVAAALRRHYAVLRAQASDHIRGLRRNAAWLKRERRRR
jgi:hypothetical protein